METPEEMTLQEQVHHAFTMHALNQGHGAGLQNAFPLKLRVKGPKPRTFILGHKAGLWLNDYSLDSFCGLGRALALHEQQNFGYLDERAPNKKADGFYVDIEGEPRRGGKAIDSNGKTFKDIYQTRILPVLTDTDPNKPRIRVRAQFDPKQMETNCAFNCDCDDSRDLEVVGLDVGSLRIFAEWHRWKEEPQVLSNSQIFVTTTLDLLYPPSAFNDQHNFIFKLPDGNEHHLVRGAEPVLSAVVQEALSRFTTRDKQEGVKPNQIELWPVDQISSGRPQFSPGQKSPSKTTLRAKNTDTHANLRTGVARAEGAIFVYRPARCTHFRYDMPQTMERFFALARSELYPNTPGKLRLRISPSNAFREQGKLLAPVEERDSYEPAVEDVWRNEILERWLSPAEDVWAVKLFVGAD